MGFIQPYLSTYTKVNKNKAFGSKLENNCNMRKRVLLLLPNNRFFWPNTMSPGAPKAKDSVSKNDQRNFGYLN